MSTSSSSTRKNIVRFQYTCQNHFIKDLLRVKGYIFLGITLDEQLQ